MTTTTSNPQDATGTTGWLRRHRALALVGAALVTATLLTVLSGSDDQYTADLDPGNSGPAGARAVAQVLENQGIEVTVARSAAEFADAEIDATSTILVTSTESLGRTTAEQLTDAASVTEVILVDPSYGIPEVFDADEGRGYSGTRKVEAVCSDRLVDGLRAETRAGSAFPTTPGSCFPDGPGALLTTPRDGVRFLGAADLLSNEQITRSDNAAIALRLLGQRDRLIWYVPDPADLAADDAVSFGSLLPDWLGPGLLVGSVAVVALMLWRGRRLGPLAIEPLPVAITAIETTRSRGRLYRKANDRGYAAEALRSATRTELAEHLLLPRHAAGDVDLLVGMLASYSALDPGSLRALLTPGAPAPSSDRELITLANDLAALSREVRRP